MKRAPGAAGISALVLNVPVYGALHLPLFTHVAFLNKMAITFGTIIGVMTVITLTKPLRKPFELPVKEGFDTRPAGPVVWLGTTIIVVTVCLYILFR